MWWFCLVAGIMCRSVFDSLAPGGSNKRIHPVPSRLQKKLVTKYFEEIHSPTSSLDKLSAEGSAPTCMSEVFGFSKNGEDAPFFQKYTAPHATTSVLNTKGNDFQTKGTMTLSNGSNRNRIFNISFSSFVHSLARRDGTVNIQIDHILHTFSLPAVSNKLPDYPTIWLC